MLIEPVKEKKQSNKWFDKINTTASGLKKKRLSLMSLSWFEAKQCIKIDQNNFEWPKLTSFDIKFRFLILKCQKEKIFTFIVKVELNLFLSAFKDLTLKLWLEFRINSKQYKWWRTKDNQSEWSVLTKHNLAKCCEKE